MSAPRPGPLEWFARRCAVWAGSSWAFALAVLIIAVWASLGAHYDYNDTWQLVVNTGTTIVTFLMVFLIQRSQNKDGLAIQLKLNELIAAVRGASNRLINVEDLTEAEVIALHQRYACMVEQAKRSGKLDCALSVDAADAAAETERIVRS